MSSIAIYCVTFEPYLYIYIYIDTHLRDSSQFYIYIYIDTPLKDSSQLYLKKTSKLNISESVSIMVR